MAGVRINDIPKFLSEDPDEKTHTTIVDEPLNPNKPLIILIVLKGFTSYFPSRKPRASEYEDDSIPHIEMTRKPPVWEPSETRFTEQEDAMTNFRGEVISSETIERGIRTINSLSTGEDDVVYFTYEETLFNAINDKVKVSRFFASKGRHSATLDSLFQK